MTIQRKRRRARLFIGTGILMAVIVGATTLFMLQQAPQPVAEEVPMADVVVAARDIPARTPIQDGDLLVRSVPADAASPFAVTDMAEVMGRSTAVALVPGQIITPNLLVSTDPTQGGNVIPAPGATFDPNGPPVRAASVSVPDASAAGGMIQPGHRVDVVATVPIPAPAEAAPAEGEEAVASNLTAGPSTKVTLQNITVLSRAADIYILQVDLEMAEQIAEITAAGGTFTLVLRPDADTRTAETDGSTLDELVDEFGFRIPRVPSESGSTPTDFE